LRRDAQTRTIQFSDFAKFFNDASEHAI